MQAMNSRRDPHHEFERAYSKTHIGYVLITCGKPSDSGEMQVEMTYGGSTSLAHMLVDGAQSILDGSSQQEENVCLDSGSTKVHQLC